MTSARCTDAIKAWDEPPPSWSETMFPHIARRKAMISPSSFESSQTPFMADGTKSEMDQTRLTTGVTWLASSIARSTNQQALPTNFDTLSNRQTQYFDRFLNHLMMGFIAFVALSLIIVYVVRLLRRKSFGKQTAYLKSEKTKPVKTLLSNIYPTVIRNTATNGLHVGNRYRRATSTQYRKGDIWTAAYSGSVEAIASFQAENRYTNINEINPRLGTPFQAACQGGQFETAKTLLKWGADPIVQGGRFKTCLVAAAYSGNCDVVRLLLDRGVSINEYNEVAGSVLHAACERGSQDMVELLVINGADVRASGGSYGTPLQAASFRGNPRVVSLLLEKGAEVNVIGGQYGTSLHAAAVDGHVETSEVLLKHGADVNFKTETYGTALQIAC